MKWKVERRGKELMRVVKYVVGEAWSGPLW